MADVLIYTKPDCPYCAKAKEFYNGKGISFNEVDVIGDPEARKKLLDLTGGKRFVPVIVDKGEVKIGWEGGG